GRRCRVEREAGFLTAHEEHLLAHASADGVDRHQRPARVLSRRRQRLQQQQFDAGKLLVLARHDNVADDTCELHYSERSTSSTMPTMAASTGPSSKPAAMRAELPLTTSTVSPTPASTVSMATR